MLEEQLHIVDGNIYAYLLVDYATSDILDGNKLARNYYKSGGNYLEISEIFSPSVDGDSVPHVIKNVPLSASTLLNGITSSKADGTSFLSDVEVCKLDKSHLLLVVKEQHTAKDSHLGDIMDLADNPVFQISDDNDFTICYGNPRFFHAIHMIQSQFHDELQSAFLSLLPKDKQFAFAHKVTKAFELDGECDITVELESPYDEGKLYQFNAFKSVYDKNIYGVLISVKNQSELLKKIEYDQQYFDVMQKYTKDLLFRIDIRSKTLVHRGDISMLVDLLPEMKQFPECMRKSRLVHPDDMDAYIAYAYLLMSGTEASLELKLQFSNNTFEKYRLQGTPLFNEEGYVHQVVGKCENIQKFVEIERKANYDSLTSALNKHSFRELIQHSMENAVTSDKFAILFLDIDDFKGVNDNLGHVFGDFLLEAISKRIMNCIRSQDRMGRVGGDEFVVFFQYAPTHEAVQERAEEILHSLRREFTRDLDDGSQQRKRIKASIGISLFPEHGNTYNALYEKADLALYESKRLGKDIATIYYEELETKPNLLINSPL